MKNFKKLRQSRHLSQQKLADKFSLSQQSIYKYENNLSEPDIQTLKNFADFFHTSIDTLVDYTPAAQLPDSSSLSSEETHLLHLYHSLPEDMRKHVLALLEALV